MKYFRNMEIVACCVKCGQTPRLEKGTLLYSPDVSNGLQKLYIYFFICHCYKAGMMQGVGQSRKAAFGNALRYWNTRNVP
jgi:hypothetical protein